MASPDPATPAARELFLDALDLPERKRDAFVDEACRGDASLCDRVYSSSESWMSVDASEVP